MWACVWKKTFVPLKIFWPLLQATKLDQLFSFSNPNSCSSQSNTRTCMGKNSISAQTISRASYPMPYFWYLKNLHPLLSMIISIIIITRMSCSLKSLENHSTFPPINPSIPDTRTWAFPNCCTKLDQYFLQYPPNTPSDASTFIHPRNKSFFPLEFFHQNLTHCFVACFFFNDYVSLAQTATTE